MGKRKEGETGGLTPADARMLLKQIVYKYYFMDTSSAAAECNTLQAASGAVVHLFPTGQGNIVGNPVMPVIKLTANPKTARTMAEHIDLDVSGLLRREMTLDQAGDRLIDIALRTCNGRLTAAEALGHNEFVITKLYRSA